MSAQGTEDITGILAAMNSGAPGGHLASMGIQASDVFLSFTATGGVVILTVDDSLTSESIEVGRLENMGGGIASDSRDICTAASGRSGTNSQGIGLPLRDNHRGSSIGDGVMPEAKLTGSTGHTKRAVIARIAGEAEHIGSIIQHGDQAASTKTGHMAHLESLGFTLEEIVSYQVTGIGIEAIVITINKSLADIRTGQRRERQAQGIRHLLLPIGASLTIENGGLVCGKEPIIQHKRGRRLSHTSGQRGTRARLTLSLERSKARSVELHEIIESIGERHTRVDGHRTLHRAEAILASKAMETEQARAREMGEHPRAIATTPAVAFIAEVSPLGSGLDTESGHQAVGVIPETGLHHSQAVIAQVILADEALNCRTFRHIFFHLTLPMQRLTESTIKQESESCNNLILGGLQISVQLRSISETERSERRSYFEGQIKMKAGTSKHPVR